MSLGKKDIVKNISSKTHFSKLISDRLLNSFINIIKNKTEYKTIKISNFGTFSYKKSPYRLGRNPKTKESFPITERSKLTFLSSNTIRKILN